MKRAKPFYLTIASCLIGAAAFTSCWQDRSGEYYALVGAQNWIYTTMQQDYLYYRDLPEESELNFFQKPAEFLKSVVSEKDGKNGATYSHIDSVSTADTRALSERPTFGFEVALLQTTQNDYVMQVLYTQPGSPAEEAGLKRGDLIIGADDAAIRPDDYTEYVARPTRAHTFLLGTYHAETSRIDTLGRVEMPAPRLVEMHNLLKTSLLDTGTRRAAYILYNEFGQDDDIAQWQALYSRLAAAQPDDIILDLRYNPGGYVSTAQAVATLLAPPDALGRTMLSMTGNDKSGEPRTYTFDAALLPGGSAPGYRNLYVITSGQTASASEIVINCLAPYMAGRLYQVGQATFGKNVAQSLYTDDRYSELELWLTTYYLSNAEGYKDYDAEGLPPDYPCSEAYGLPLGELGTETDPLLRPVLVHMATGAFPAVETVTRTPPTPPMLVVRTSIADKAKAARIVPAREVPSDNLTGK